MPHLTKCNFSTTCEIFISVFPHLNGKDPATILCNFFGYNLIRFEDNSVVAYYFGDTLYISATYGGLPFTIVDGVLRQYCHSTSVVPGVGFLWSAVGIKLSFVGGRRS